MARSNSRTDEELDAILAEIGHWSVNGQSGQVLCFSTNLHNAIERATGFAASGAVVTFIVQMPFGTIVVPPDQISTLRQRIASRELPVAAHTANNSGGAERPVPL
jgi:hypothetical protein